MKALENGPVLNNALDTIASSRKHVEPVPGLGHYNDEDAAKIKAKLEAVATYVIDFLQQEFSDSNIYLPEGDARPQKRTVEPEHDTRDGSPHMSTPSEKPVMKLEYGSEKEIHNLSTLPEPTTERDHHPKDDASHARNLSEKPNMGPDHGGTTAVKTNATHRYTRSIMELLASLFSWRLWKAPVEISATIRAFRLTEALC
jgi:hypothetical protein